MVCTRLKPWKMKPISSRSSLVVALALRLSTRRPLSQISPESAVSRQPIMCSRVDLPHPDGPMMATISPGLISTEAPRRASTKLSLPN